MASTDPIADGLTKIYNASQAKHPTVEVRASRLMGQILEVLKREGFIRTYKLTGQTPAQRVLRVYLKYALPAAPGAAWGGKKTPAIKRLIRVSKPGARHYRKARELPRVLGGLGVAIISTSKGLMAEREAYRQRIGGEVICYVW